jgi:transglutaminase-like putative cysteine protease
MFDIYEVRHRTTYRYAEPVGFGAHRVLFRPRESSDLKVLASNLRTSPNAAVHFVRDAHSNSVAVVHPLQAARLLEITRDFTIEHAYSKNVKRPIAASAAQFPFAYSGDDRFDLEHYLRPQVEDPEGLLTQWARQFVRTDGPTGTREMLMQIKQHIRQNLRHVVRHEAGVQDPLKTLSLGSGTCRDVAFLTMEAMRQLGIAARFVSGYLYNPALKGSSNVVNRSGTIHAWSEAYLPGAGWVPLDPTNELLGGTQLIQVAVSRHPSQAEPVSGTWFGRPDSYLGMTEEVDIRRRSAIERVSAPSAIARRELALAEAA